MVSSFVEMNEGQMVPQWTDFILKKVSDSKCPFQIQAVSMLIDKLKAE